MSKINKYFCSHRCYIPEGERQQIFKLYGTLEDGKGYGGKKKASKTGQRRLGRQDGWVQF